MNKKAITPIQRIKIKRILDGIVMPHHLKEYILDDTVCRYPMPIERFRKFRGVGVKTIDAFLKEKLVFRSRLESIELRLLKKLRTATQKRTLVLDELRRFRVQIQ